VLTRRRLAGREASALCPEAMHRAAEPRRTRRRQLERGWRRCPCRIGRRQRPRGVPPRVSRRRRKPGSFAGVRRRRPGARPAGLAARVRSLRCRGAPQSAGAQGSRDVRLCRRRASGCVPAGGSRGRQARKSRRTRTELWRPETESQLNSCGEPRLRSSACRGEARKARKQPRRGAAPSSQRHDPESGRARTDRTSTFATQLQSGEKFRRSIS
jgi:hypothetical protein